MKHNSLWPTRYPALLKVLTHMTTGSQHAQVHYLKGTYAYTHTHTYIYSQVSRFPFTELELNINRLCGQQTRATTHLNMYCNTLNTHDDGIRIFHVVPTQTNKQKQRTYAHTHTHTHKSE